MTKQVNTEFNNGFFSSSILEESCHFWALEIPNNGSKSSILFLPNRMLHFTFWFQLKPQSLQITFVVVRSVLLTWLKIVSISHFSLCTWPCVLYWVHEFGGAVTFSTLKSCLLYHISLKREINTLFKDVERNVIINVILKTCYLMF